MNQDKLKELIGESEPGTVEFKKNFDREAMETALAFANTKGGVIFRKDIYTGECLCILA